MSRDYFVCIRFAPFCRHYSYGDCFIIWHYNCSGKAFTDSPDWSIMMLTERLIIWFNVVKEVLDKKELQQNRFYSNRAHSNCSFASLKWFRKLHVHHAFLINVDKILSSIPLREKCPYSEIFWSAFSRIWTEYGEILRVSPYSVRIRENADQNNSEYRHFLRSVLDL